MDVLEQLELEEGYREKPYHCTEGYPTIGIGLRIGPKNAPLSHYEIKMSKTIAYAYLNEKVELIQNQLASSSATMLAWENCSQARKVILTSMAYQLGFDGLCKFKKMIKAIEQCDWNEARNQALDSRWARQTPKRAYRQSEVLFTGTWEIYR